MGPQEVSHQTNELRHDEARSQLEPERILKEWDTKIILYELPFRTAVPSSQIATCKIGWKLN